MKRLDNRVAIVTGSARGFGLAIAEALAKEGARVVITDILDDGIRAAVQGLQAKGYSAMGVKVDVSNKAQVQAMVRQVREAWGGIDLLVNNAGGGWVPRSGCTRSRRSTGTWCST